MINKQNQHQNQNTTNQQDKVRVYLTW